MTKEQENRRDDGAIDWINNPISNYVDGIENYKAGYNAGLTDGERSGISKVIEYLRQFSYMNDSMPAHGNSWASNITEHFADVLKVGK